MNLSISRSYFEFQLISLYVSWDIANKRHKPHFLDPWHSSPQHLPPATSSPGIELGKERISIRIITHIHINIFVYMYIYIYNIYMYIYIYISEHKQNAHNDGNRAQPLKRILKTLFLAIKKCTGFTTNFIWVNTKVCSVTRERTQSSSRCVSSLKDSPVLLTTESWTSYEWSPSNR